MLVVSYLFSSCPVLFFNAFSLLVLSSPGLSCPAFFVLSLLCLVFVFDVVLVSFCLCLRSYLCFGLSLSSLSCLRRTSGFVFVFVFIFVFIVVSHLEVFEVVKLGLLKSKLSK